MNILIINGNCNGGGAAKIAKELWRGLNEKGVKAYFIAARGTKKEKEDGITILFSSVLCFIFHKAWMKFCGNVCFTNRVACKKIIRFIKEKDIDIIHFHNIANNYIGFEDLKIFSQYCKVVWTLHELWAVTGHCFHPMECAQWQDDGCMKCPDLTRAGAIYCDISHKIWLKKRESFTKRNIEFTVPSIWMKNQLAKSFLRDESITVIHNGIDIEKYKEYDVNSMRKKHKIDLKKHVLLYVAADLNNKDKGIDVYLQALKEVQEKCKYFLIFVGTGTIDKRYIEGFEALFPGEIKDCHIMNEIYSASDILIQPSKAESFSLVAAEAMACGTPVVTFRSGGVEEIVDEYTGWFVEKREADILKTTIEAAFADMQLLEMKRSQCRKRIQSLFSRDHMIAMYKEMYERLLKNE